MGKYEKPQRNDVNSTERSDILVFNCYLCHVSFLLTCYGCSTKIGEISDISKCFENFVSQALGFLKRFYAAELRYYIKYSSMKKKCFISIAAFIMLSCMASSPQQSLQSRLFGFWSPSGDEVTVLKIDKDSLYYVDEYPIVAKPYQFAGDSMTIDADGTTIVQHISFHKDTLVMKNQWGDVSCFVPVK